MSPEYRKWPDVPDQYPNYLKSEIIGFIGEKELGNAIQQGFYFLRSGNENKEIKKVILCPGREGDISENQKKQALKENSDWYLVHGLKDCSKQKNNQPRREYYDAARRDIGRRNWRINASRNPIRGK